MKKGSPTVQETSNRLCFRHRSKSNSITSAFHLVPKEVVQELSKMPKARRICKTQPQQQKGCLNSKHNVCQESRPAQTCLIRLVTAASLPGIIFTILSLVVETLG